MSIVRRKPNRLSREKNPKRNQPSPNTPIVIDVASTNGTVLTLTLDQPVSLKGTPQILTNIAGPVPVSAEQVSPAQIAVTFDGDISSATSLIVPHRDPAIRNSVGGYIYSNTFPLAA